VAAGASVEAAAVGAVGGDVVAANAKAPLRSDAVTATAAVSAVRFGMLGTS
jgi:hypothetical protein